MNSKFLFKNYKKQKGRKQPKRKAKGKRAAKPLSKNAYQAVARLVDRKLDHAVEDKFVNTFRGAQQTFVSADPQNDAANFCALYDVTPTIAPGSGVAQRIGEKVTLKHITYNLLVRGTSQFFTVPFAGPIPGAIPTNPIMSARGLDIKLTYLLVNRDNASTASEVNELYRPQGMRWQDVSQAASQAARRDFKLLGKRTCKVPYRLVTNVDTAGGNIVYQNIPVDYRTSVKLSLNRKMLFETIGNQPSKYKIKLLIQYNKFPQMQAVAGVPNIMEGYSDRGMPIILSRPITVYEDA